jgi:type I site-specific restriction-modification system R (restriction) subunit
VSDKFTESTVEDATLAWLQALGYTILHGPEIGPDNLTAERSDSSYRDVVLEGRLGHALSRLNPDLPPEALEDAFRKLTRIDAPSLLERNRAPSGCSWTASTSRMAAQRRIWHGSAAAQTSDQPML